VARPQPEAGNGSEDLTNTAVMGRGRMVFIAKYRKLHFVGAKEKKLPFTKPGDLGPGGCRSTYRPGVGFADLL